MTENQVKELKSIITEAWNNACENGDEQELRSYTPEQLSVDMYDRLWFPFEFEYEEFEPLVKEFYSNGYRFN